MDRNKYLDKALQVSSLLDELSPLDADVVLSIARNLVIARINGQDGSQTSEHSPDLSSSLASAAD